MSSPRAATSVATSSSVRPLRRRSTTRERCSWSMPPCSASARRPRAVSVSVTASTSSRVRQNTIAAFGPLGLQHPAQRGGGVRARHEVRGLADQRRLALGHHLAAHPHGDRLAQVVARQVLDAARHRRGEQHALAGVRGGVEQGLDVLDEAHVEHLVGLVEHDDLELVEPQRAAVHQVDRPAGGGDDDVDALGQAAQLRADGGAAVDGEHAGAHAAAVAGDGLGDLQRELAGRGEDEAERGGAAGAARALLAQALQHRQREGGGLAGAGGGLTDQVTALDQRRDRLGLDRGGGGVAERGDGPLELGAQREVGEGRALLEAGVSAVSSRAGSTTTSFSVTSVSRRTEREHGRCTRGAKPADVVAHGRTAGFLDSQHRTDRKSSHRASSGREPGVTPARAPVPDGWMSYLPVAAVLTHGGRGGRLVRGHAPAAGVGDDPDRPPPVGGAPHHGQPAGRQVRHRPADHVVATVDRRVARGEQGDPEAGGDRLERLVPRWRPRRRSAPERCGGRWPARTRASAARVKLSSSATARNERRSRRVDVGTVGHSGRLCETVLDGGSPDERDRGGVQAAGPRSRIAVVPPARGGARPRSRLPTRR